MNPIWGWVGGGLYTFLEGVYSGYLPPSLSCRKIWHLTQAWPDTPDSNFESRASDPKKQGLWRILSGGSGKASLDFHEGGANAGSRVQGPVPMESEQ